MNERGWRLEYPGVTYEWGGLDPVGDPFRLFRGRARNTSVPEITDTEVETEVGGRPRQDGQWFGQDFRRGVTITFQLGLRGVAGAGAEQSVRQLLRAQQLAWRGDGVRMQPGALAKLTTMQDGRELTTYGRPRRWAANTNLVRQGEASAVATFDTMDDVWYGAEQLSRVDIVPPTSTQGITLPVAPPHVLGVNQEGPTTVLVDGVLPAWVTAEVFGPIANPVVKLAGGWEFRLSATILAGQSVTIDARPWRRTILSSAGASLAGKRLRQYAALADLQLQVGAAAVTLAGADPTGTSYMNLRWTPAHASMA